MFTHLIKSRMTPVKFENGSTLFMSLLLLLAISLLGLNSIKGTGVNTRLSANSIATERTFQAAESAIDRIFLEGSQDETDAFFIAMHVGEQYNCITHDGIKASKCERTDVFDSYGNFSSEFGNTLFAASKTKHIGEGPAAGYDTKLFATQVFETTGASFYAPEMRVNYATENVLHWKRFGPATGFKRAE